MQQAQALIDCGAFNPIAAVHLRREGQPVVTLNVTSRLRDILPGRRLINKVDCAKPLGGDRLPGQIKHQQDLVTALWTGKRRWWFNHGHHLISSS